MTVMKKLEDLIVRDKRVFVRVDFNVPLHNGEVSDELRIEAALPTIRYLIEQRAKIILASHLGRPDGRPDSQYSLEPVAVLLSKLLRREVLFLHDCVGEDISAKVMSLRSGQVALLENLRYHAEEEAGDDKFAHQLANLAEVYVDDAFAVAHRAHASIVGVPKFLPHAAGKLLQSEVATLTGLMSAPKKPFVAIIGGAKISDKIEFMKNLMKKADTIIVSGAMANTFLAAQGHDMGSSVLDKKGFGVAREIMADAQSKNIELILPVDVVVASSPTSKRTRTVTVGQLEEDDMALDIGPASITNIHVALHSARTIFWNGTLGYTEESAFRTASTAVAKTIATSPALSVIGGGDTAGFIDSIGMHAKFGFISTGGGAALELLAGKKLPAVVALSR
jgi:phosphoglycerate kinase